MYQGLKSPAVLFYCSNVLANLPPLPSHSIATDLPPCSSFPEEMLSNVFLRSEIAVAHGLKEGSDGALCVSAVQLVVSTGHVIDPLREPAL